MVRTRPLKSWRWTWIIREVPAEQIPFGARGHLEAGEVDRDGSIIGDAPVGGAVVADVDRSRAAPAIVGAVARQQLIDRDVVELGQPLQAGDRDRPLAALIGAEHRSLELLVGRGLHGLQREPLLFSDVSKALSNPPCVVQATFLFAVSIEVQPPFADPSMVARPL